MSFYIRKALRVGPLRFNLSKSGIGVSAGIRGLRLGTGPRGNYIHMGRGGLYFRQSLGQPAPRARKRSPALAPNAEPDTTVGPMVDVESGPVQDMVDSSSADLLRELNDKRKKLALFPFAATALAGTIVLLLVGDHSLWLVGGVAIAGGVVCWFVRMKDALRRFTVIMYDLEPDTEAAYQRLHTAFVQLRGCSRIWHVEAKGTVRDQKYHAGAGSLVQRKPSALSVGAPPLIRTNVQVPLIPAGRQILALMPDRLLVFDSGAVGAVPYAQLNVFSSASRFIEDGALPSDATVVGRTWRYVNKSGGPDRRFRDNRELPICAYDELHLTSPTGLDEVLQISRGGAGTAFRDALEEIRFLERVNAVFPPV